MAVDNVADPALFPDYFVRQSEGSKRGLQYLAANNGRIPNTGEQHLCCLSEEGNAFKVRMQSAAVSRPILSVMRLAEYGKDVTFRHDGGTIRDRKTGRTTEFQKKHGVYVLKAWLMATPESSSTQIEAGFTRQG